jgi:hypothetical protein
VGLGGTLRVEDELNQAGAIPKIDENEAAVIAASV